MLIREEASRIREDALRIREDALRFCKGLCGCVKYQEGSSLRMRKDNSTLRIRKEKISTLRMRKVKICLWCLVALLHKVSFDCSRFFSNTAAVRA